MIILLPWSPLNTPNSSLTGFARHKLTHTSITHLMCSVYEAFNGMWYCYMPSRYKSFKNRFATSERAMKALDSVLIEQKYILCDTEEQVNKYRLLL